MQQARRAQMPRHKPQGRALESQNWRPGPPTAENQQRVVSTIERLERLERLYGQVTSGCPVSPNHQGISIPFPEVANAASALKAQKKAIAEERAQRIKRRQEADASRKPINTLYIGNLPETDSTKGLEYYYKAELRAHHERILKTDIDECFGSQPGFRRSYVECHDGTPQALVQFHAVEDAVAAKEAMDGKFLPCLELWGRKGGMRLSFARNPMFVGTSYKQAPIGIWEARAESKRQAQLQRSAISTPAFGLLGKANLLQHSSKQPKKLSAAAFAPEQPLFMVPIKKSHAVEIRPDPKSVKDRISPQKSVQPQAPTPDRHSPVDSVLTASDNKTNHSRSNSSSSGTSGAISSSSALTEEELLYMESRQCQNCGEQYESSTFNAICPRCEGSRVMKPRVSEQEEFPGFKAFKTQHDRMHQEASKPEPNHVSKTSKAATPAEEDSSNKQPSVCLSCNWQRDAGSPLCQVCDRFWKTGSRMSEQEARAWADVLKKRREEAPYEARGGVWSRVEKNRSMAILKR
ncbi:hypothetical protein HII31_06123 [Pseudocercospora fuligena]|uniref:Uncharacterized protein n=1 Tax=Pseudocercospora fuligena TaxID=685502 RepID=A0A8H6RL02_9PEZI|nr:hypothetical protein HII31_06123 [Pseudocercospora fuligena]